MPLAMVRRLWAFGAAGDDRAVFVVVDDGWSAADASSAACSVKAFLGLAGDVAASVLSQGEGGAGATIGGVSSQDQLMKAPARTAA